MNHPFQSHRDTLNNATRGKQLIADLIAIAGADASDRMCIVERRDPHIKSPQVASAVARNASRLGVMVDDLRELLSTPVPASVGSAWLSFVSSGTEMDVTVLTRDVQTSNDALQTTIDKSLVYEMDDASSSASDYSDSDTSSTNEDCGGEDDEDDEDDDASP